MLVNVPMEFFFGGEGGGDGKSLDKPRRRQPLGTRNAATAPIMSHRLCDWLMLVRLLAVPAVVFLSLVTPICCEVVLREASSAAGMRSNM